MATKMSSGAFLHWMEVANYVYYPFKLKVASKEYKIMSNQMGQLISISYHQKFKGHSSEEKKRVKYFIFSSRNSQEISKK